MNEVRKIVICKTKISVAFLVKMSFHILFYRFVVNCKVKIPVVKRRVFLFEKCALNTFLYGEGKREETVIIPVSLDPGEDF